MQTIKNKSIQTLDFDASRISHAMDSLGKREAEVMYDILEKRLKKIKSVRDEKYRNLRDVYKVETEVFDEQYLEGYIREIEFLGDEYRIDLDVHNVILPLYLKDEEDITEVFQIGEYWEFFCLVIPREEGLKYVVCTV